MFILAAIQAMVPIPPAKAVTHVQTKIPLSITFTCKPLVVGVERQHEMATGAVEGTDEATGLPFSTVLPLRLEIKT